MSRGTIERRVISLLGSFMSEWDVQDHPFPMAPSEFRFVPSGSADTEAINMDEKWWERLIEGFMSFLARKVRDAEMSYDSAVHYAIGVKRFYIARFGPHCPPVFEGALWMKKRKKMRQECEPRKEWIE